MSLVRQAYERGRESAHFGFMRVSPFYDERVLIRGKRVDITPMLHYFWLAGFDGEPYPELPNALDPETNPISVVERQPA